jgi:hypothetical protein
MHGGGGWPATGNTVSSYAIYAVYAVYTVYTQYIRVVKILKYALVPTLCMHHAEVRRRLGAIVTQANDEPAQQVSKLAVPVSLAIAGST